MVIQCYIGIDIDMIVFPVNADQAGAMGKLKIQLSTATTQRTLDDLAYRQIVSRELQAASKAKLSVLMSRVDVAVEDSANGWKDANDTTHQWWHPAVRAPDAGVMITTTPVRDEDNAIFTDDGMPNDSDSNTDDYQRYDGPVRTFVLLIRIHTLIYPLIYPPIYPSIYHSNQLPGCRIISAQSLR